jgi:hypothetical protein
MVRALAVLAWVVWTPAAFGGQFVPPLHVASCTKRATHVVVVREVDKTDGTVEVLESWVGGLREGDILRLPSLAAFATLRSRAISEVPGPPARHTHVTGSRIVLFLRWQPEGADLSKGTWKPAGGDVGTSAVWVEGGEAYAALGYSAFGMTPRIIMPLRMTEQKLRERVRDGVAAGSNE